MKKNGSRNKQYKPCAKVVILAALRGYIPMEDYRENRQPGRHSLRIR